MGAIWYDHGQPSFLGIAPSFSFIDVAEVIAPAPESYAEARQRLQAWERKVGAVYMRHNAAMAYFAWQAKKPWYCYL